MSVLTPSLPLPVNGAVAVPSEPIWRLTVEKYHAMIRAGILTEEDPVELLEGWLVTKMPKSPPHRAVTRLVRKALEDVLPTGWYVDSQEPFTTGDSEPEPDVMVVRGETRQYLDRHPGPQDLALLVEVADATLQRDRTSKKRIYARAGVVTYWIVNLVDRQIEIYTDPSGPAETPDYRQRQDCGPEDHVPFILDGQEVCQFLVRDLLP